MAYDPNELFSTTLVGKGLRFYPTIVRPKTFAGGTALIKKGTPVAKHTSGGSDTLWAEWDSDGATGLQVLEGFAWPDDIQLISGKEVLGNVMLAGKLHYADIVLPTSGAENATTLNAELRSQDFRAKGFDIDGLSAML